MIRFSKIIAAVLVLLAFLLSGYAWMLSRKPAAPVAPPPPVAKAATPEATFPVVVTTKALPAGQAIDASALRVAQLTINPGGAFMSVSEVLGRVPVFDLGTGSPLLENQLVSGLSMRLEAGQRAVAVKVDEVMGVGNSVRPGDFVDVFFALKADGKDVDHSQSRLLLARQRVLAFGAASVDSMPANGEGRTQQKPQGAAQQAARTAVLAVAVEDVNRLSLGDAHGRLLLALRHPNDTAEPDPALFAELQTALQPKTGQRGAAPLSGVDRAVAGLTTEALAAGGSATRARGSSVAPSVGTARPVRTAVAATGHEVEIIRGERRDTVRY